MTPDLFVCVKNSSGCEGGRRCDFCDKTLTEQMSWGYFSPFKNIERIW